MDAPLPVPSLSGGHRHSTRIAAVLVVLGLLLLSFGGSVIWATSRSGVPPAPLPKPFSVRPAPSTAPNPGLPVGGGPGVPNTLVIPSLSVRASILPVSIVNGDLGVPANVRQVGIYTGGGQVDGSAGTVLIDGHVNFYNQGPGALSALADIAPNAVVDVFDQAGLPTVWTVTSIQAMPQSQLPQDIFSGSGPRQLVLVTCGGPYDRSTHTYDDNVVARAVEVSR